jgi:nucleoside-diphosphate-sugar epimerase
MRVLVTGASGFVGAELVPALAAAGHDVVALVRDASRAPADAGSVLELDLEQPLSPRDMPRVDAVVHLAQANVSFQDAARELYRVNTVATQELLEYARVTGAARFVYASSGSIFGLGEGTVSEDDPRRATDFYSVTKQSAELLVGAYRDHFATTIVRPFAPYGPTQTGRLIPNLIRRVREGLPVTLNEGGRPRMTPLYVDDVLRAFAAALELDGHHVVNVAGDEAVGIDELASFIGDVVGREPVFEHGPGASGDLIADNTRMKELLAPGPLVPLADGLRATALAGTPA